MLNYLCSHGIWMLIRSTGGAALDPFVPGTVSHRGGSHIRNSENLSVKAFCAFCKCTVIVCSFSDDINPVLLSVPLGWRAGVVSGVF